MILNFASVATWFISSENTTIGVLTDWSVGGESVPPSGVGGGTRDIAIGFFGGAQVGRGNGVL